MMNGGPENVPNADGRPDETEHPAGEMRLTRRGRIAARLSVLAGLGVVAIGTAPAHTSTTLVSPHNV
jgi:hypothetical protein